MWNGLNWITLIAISNTAYEQCWKASSFTDYHQLKNQSKLLLKVKYPAMAFVRYYFCQMDSYVQIQSIKEIGNFQIASDKIAHSILKIYKTLTSVQASKTLGQAKQILPWLASHTPLLYSFFLTFLYLITLPIAHKKHKTDIICSISFHGQIKQNIPKMYCLRHSTLNKKKNANPVHDVSWQDLLQKTILAQKPLLKTTTTNKICLNC